MPDHDTVRILYIEDDPGLARLFQRKLERAGHVRRVRDSEDRRRVSLEMSDSAMAAGAAYFGGLQRDLIGAMKEYSDDELAVVGRFLHDMTEVIVRHARPDAGAQR